MFLAHKSSYIGMLLLVLLSTACYLGFKTPMAGIRQGVINNRENSKLEDASFSLSVTMSDAMLSLYENLFSLSLEECPSIEMDEGYQGAALRLFPKAQKMNLPLLYEGEDITNSADILVDRYFFNAQGLTFGDTVTLFGKVYTIRGIFTTPNYLTVTRRDTDFMADGSKFGLVLMSRDAFSALPAQEMKTDYAVRFSSDNEKAFRTMLSLTNFITDWVPRSTNTRITNFDGEIGAIVVMSVVAPLFLLLVSTAILAVVQSRMLKKEYPYIGTLTALGYRKREILLHYLRLPAALSLLGSALGVALGFFLIKPFTLVTSTEYNIPRTLLNVNPWDIALILCVPILLNCLAVAFSVLHALRIDTVHLLKGDTASKRHGLLIRLVPYKKGSFKTRFRLKENLCNLPRSLLMLTGIVAASLFMMTGFLFYGALDFMFECNFNTLFGFRYQYVYNTLETENSTAGEPYMMASYYFDKGGSHINFTIHGTADNPKYIRLKDSNGQEIDPSKTVATRSAARRMGWKEGDTVTVVSNATLAKVTLTIDEICDIRYSDYVFMPMKKLNGMLNLNEDTHIGVYSAEPLPMDQNIVEDVLTADDSQAGAQASVAAFRAYLYILASFSSLISLIVVYIVTSMLIEENRKNISLMKVMGYQDKEVSRLLLHSTSFLAFIGFFLAIPLTLSLVRSFFGMLTSNMFFDFAVNLSWQHGIYSLVLVMMVYYLTLFMNRRKVQRINMAESLKARE